MPDYQPQNPQPKKRYKRQTPVLHVPTRDEWRKLGYISAAVGGSGTAIATLIFGYKAISTYLMYVKDIVIQHGLLVTAVYGALSLSGLAIALLVGIPTSARGYFAITKRHRPGYLLSTVGNTIITLALYAGVSFTTNKTISAFVGLSRRLKDLQKPHYPIAYDVIDLDVNSASDAFKTYIVQTNTVFAIVAGVIALSIIVAAAFYNDKLNSITNAQELTPKEHAERQLGLNAIRKYVQDRTNPRVNKLSFCSSCMTMSILKTGFGRNTTPTIVCAPTTRGSLMNSQPSSKVQQILTTISNAFGRLTLTVETSNQTTQTSSLTPTTYTT